MKDMVTPKLSLIGEAVRQNRNRQSALGSPSIRKYNSTPHNQAKSIATVLEVAIWTNENLVFFFHAFPGNTISLAAATISLLHDYFLDDCFSKSIALSSAMDFFFNSIARPISKCC